MNPPDRSPDDVPDLRQQAMAWFVRRRDAGWSGGDEAAFQAWLASDARHEPAYRDCRSRWREFDAMPADLVQRLRGNLARDKAIMGKLAAPPLPLSVPDSPARRRFLQPVALAGIAAAGGAGLLAWRHVDAEPTLVLASATGRGQQRDLPLPDGTRLRLDTATRVEITYYRHRREVKLLDGQVVFDVQADPKRPFHVQAGPLRVTVVGTRFSVRHTPGIAGNDGVLVSVAHGKVRVERAGEGIVEGTAAGRAGTLLGAGQQLASDRFGVPGLVERLPPYAFAPWRDSMVSFVDVPLSQALAELARYHPTGLLVRDPAVAALRLSGTFDPMRPASLRSALPRVLPVRLSGRGAEMEVVSANR